MTTPVRTARKIISGSGWANPLEWENAWLESASHLEVWADDTLLTLGADYSVIAAAGSEVPVQNGLNDPAGFGVELVDEELVVTYFVLVLRPPVTQSADLSSGGRFGIAAEAAIDAIVRRIQALEDRVNRAVKTPLTEAIDAPDLTIEIIDAGRIWKADANGNMVDGGPATDVAAAVAAIDAEEAAAIAAIAAAEATTIEAAEVAALASVGALVDDAEAAASTATTQAGIATTQAGIATTQAGVATTQAGIATTQAGIATTQAGIATTQAGLASASATAADGSADAAAASALAADGSADAAAASALAADGSADAAAASEVAAEADRVAVAADKVIASAAADAAAAAQVAAEAARDATLAAYDTFDDRFLGSKTSDPTLDNDGNALVAGSIYFNSVDGAMKVYTGSAWVAAYVSGGSFAVLANNGSDYVASTFRTNLDLYSTAEVLALPFGRTAKTTLVDADTFSMTDSAASNVWKKITWANIKTALNALYQPLAAALTSWAGVSRAANFDAFVSTPSSANLRALLTDEVGTGAAYFVGGALGTPASATLTNATGLPIAGLVASTTQAIGVGSVELGHASDTTIARSAAGVVTIEGIEVVTLSRTQTLTNKTLTDPSIVGTITEDVYVITDGAGFAIDPTNGSIQRVTLGANRTPTVANWADGDSVTLLIADGTAYTITWTTIGVVWKGGSAPALATTGYTEINITRENGVYRGVHVGDFAS